MKMFYQMACIACGLAVSHAEMLVVESGIPAMPKIAALHEEEAEAKELTKHRQEVGDIYAAAEAMARAGKTEAAMSRLQQAMREDECDMAEVESDEIFAAVVKHKKWPEVKKDLLECEKLWRASSYRRTMVTVPQGHVRGAELPLVVGMHGYGSLPEDFCGDDIQAICDERKVAFVSVSGLHPLGKHSFMWSGDGTKDGAHVFSCLDAVKEIVKESPGRTVAMGFSQGGKMAQQLLAMHPKRIAGIVSMSPAPGFAAGLRGSDAAPLRGKTAFLSWISGEGAGMARRCEDDAKWLRQQGAKAVLREFPGRGHNWPRGYAEYFSKALEEIR